MLAMYLGSSYRARWRYRPHRFYRRVKFSISASTLKFWRQIFIFSLSKEKSSHIRAQHLYSDFISVRVNQRHLAIAEWEIVIRLLDRHLSEKKKLLHSQRRPDVSSFTRVSLWKMRCSSRKRFDFYFAGVCLNDWKGDRFLIECYMNERYKRVMRKRRRKGSEYWKRRIEHELLLIYFWSTLSHHKTVEARIGEDVNKPFICWRSTFGLIVSFMNSA